jgi:asparagine synthase (glutamine-hydrolysing)
MLHYFDRCSMAHSLEVRVPFLDHHLVELAARMPTSLKVRHLQGKHVLRRVAAPLVPDFVLRKRKQGFFNEAVGPWLSAADRTLVDGVLLAPDPAYAAILDRDAVARVVRDWRAGAPRVAPLLLAIIMLELWLSSTLPRAMAAVVPSSARAA